MSPVAVSADRRFRRAHVKPSRKRGRIRILLWPASKYAVLLAGAAFLLFRGGILLARSPMLQIDRIVVHGNGRMSSADVLAVLDPMRGQNIVSADLDGWRARLLASPWVRDVAFRRSLPSTIEVAVSEREPIGIGRVHGQLYLVDDAGGVIDAYGPQYADLDLPIIDGLAAAKDAGTPTDGERGSLAARLILSLRAKPALARRVSQVDVTDLHNAAVIVSGDPAVIYLGEDRFLPRLESYLGLATALRSRVADIDYVDLRIEDRVYVRPTGKIVKGATTPSDAGGRARAARAAAKKR